MNKALIIIDYVNDFVAENGALTCGQPAREIDANISRWVEKFSQNNDFVVVASDCHTENDAYSPERTLFPSHCICGSSGRELYGKTSEAVKQVKPELLIKIDKLRYSAFAGTNLDAKMRERNVSDVFLAGVCSDICVLHTAIDAYNLGYKINIYENAIASFNNDGHNFALNHFQYTLGANVL